MEGNITLLGVIVNHQKRIAKNFFWVFMDISFSTLKNNLRELRGERSQAEFARFCGVPQQNIAKYELGRAVPGGEALYKIATACGKSIEWILTSKSVTPTPASQTSSPTSNTAELVELYKKNSDQADTIVNLTKMNYRHYAQNIALLDELRKLRDQIMALEYRLKNEGWDAPLNAREAKYSNAYKNSLDLLNAKLKAENIELSQKLANAQRVILPPGEDFNLPLSLSYFSNNSQAHGEAERSAESTNAQRSVKTNKEK